MPRRQPAGRRPHIGSARPAGAAARATAATAPVRQVPQLEVRTVRPGTVPVPVRAKAEWPQRLQQPRRQHRPIRAWFRFSARPPWKTLVQPPIQPHHGRRRYGRARPWDGEAEPRRPGLADGDHRRRVSGGRRGRGVDAACRQVQQSRHKRRESGKCGVPLPKKQMSEWTAGREMTCSIQVAARRMCMGTACVPRQAV